MRLQLLVALLLIWFSVLGCKAFNNDAKNRSADLILYNDGVMSEISTEHSQNITRIIENQFQNSDDMYELLVTNDLIEELKNNEFCLEIIYAEKKKLVVGSIKSVEINRLLIPLSGRFVSDNQITFFCGYPQYSSGPLVCKNCFNTIKEEVLKIQKTD